MVPHLVVKEKQSGKISRIYFREFNEIRANKTVAKFHGLQ